MICLRTVVPRGGENKSKGQILVLERKGGLGRTGWEMSLIFYEDMVI